MKISIILLAFLTPMLMGAFPTTGILDTFTRGNETLGDSANWTDITAAVHKIISNQLAIDSATTHTISLWSDSTFGPDCEAYMDIVTHDMFAHVVILRATTLVQATWDGYYLYADTGNDDFEIFEVTDDSTTQLGASVAWTWADGEQLGGEIIGSIIKGYVDGVEKISRDDATHGSAGYIGIRSYTDTNTRYDDFGGGTIAPPAGEGQVIIITAMIPLLLIPALIFIKGGKCQQR